MFVVYKLLDNLVLMKQVQTIQGSHDKASSCYYFHS